MRSLIILLFLSISSCGGGSGNQTKKDSENTIPQPTYKVVCDTVEIFELDNINGNIIITEEVICDTVQGI